MADAFALQGYLYYFSTRIPIINYQISLDQAMNAIGLQGKERQAVEDELKKKDVS